MKIAYIILAHKLPAQLVRLVKKLNTETTFFLIHIDRKTDDDTYNKMVSPFNGNENVHLLKRQVVNWGTFGHVRVTLNGIREALTLGLDFDYINLLTGQDYPIKSNEYIHSFFEKNTGKSYLEYFLLPNEVWKRENYGMDRINYRYLYFLGRPRKIFPGFFLKQRKPIKKLDMFGGRSNWCLTRECVEYIDEYLRWDDTFVKFFKHVNLPDEIFFQTILLNSHLKSQLVNDSLKYVDWSNSNKLHPVILQTQDYNRLINSDKLYARKFDVKIDANILDNIDQVTS